MKWIDTVFEYRGYAPDPGFCRLEIYKVHDVHLVLIYEANGNTGTTVIESAEEISAVVTLEFELPVSHTRWIQHVVVNGEPLTQEVTFDVRFRQDSGPYFSRPVWRTITADELSLLIGEEWVPVID